MIFYTNAFGEPNNFVLTFGNNATSILILSASVSYARPAQPPPVVVANTVNMSLLVTGQLPTNYPQFTVNYIANEANLLVFLRLW